MTGGSELLSLWLIPDEPARRRLSQIMGTLAASFGSPSFEPHLTLLSSITGEARHLAERIRAAAASEAPIVLLTEPPEVSAEFFRSLYLPVRSSEPLARLHRAVCRAAGAAEPASFRPHISLAYTTAAAERRLAAAEELRASVPTTVIAEAIAIARASSGLDVRLWKILERVPLHSTAGFNN